MHLSVFNIALISQVFCSIGNIVDKNKPGDGGVVLPGDGGVVLPGDGGVVTPGDGDVVTPGEGDVVLPGDDDAVTPGEGDVVTPGEGDVVLPGDDDAVTPGDDDVGTQGDDDVGTPGDDDVGTPDDQNNNTPMNDWFIEVIKKYVDYKYGTEITPAIEETLRLVYDELRDNNDSLSIFIAISIALTKGFTVLSLGDEAQDKYIARGLLMIKGLPNYKFLRKITGNIDWTKKPEVLAELSPNAVDATLKYYTIKTRNQFVNFYNFNRILNADDDDESAKKNVSAVDPDLQEKLSVYYCITKLFDQKPVYGELLCEESAPAVE